MSLPEHSKIINEVAKQILKPQGLVRKGQSRIWYDDHGWFTTQIEFQPFSGRVGTCINVGVAFHWNTTNHMAFEIGYRESDFVYFENENQFIPEVQKLAKHALEKVFYYRKELENLQSARKIILEHKFPSDVIWGNYNKGMICGLTSEPDKAISYFDLLLNYEDFAPFMIDLKTQTKILKEIVTEQNTFYNHVLMLIFNSRTENKLPEIREPFNQLLPIQNSKLKI